MTTSSLAPRQRCSPGEFNTQWEGSGRFVHATARVGGGSQGPMAPPGRRGASEATLNTWMSLDVWRCPSRNAGPVSKVHAVVIHSRSLVLHMCGGEVWLIGLSCRSELPQATWRLHQVWTCLQRLCRQVLCVGAECPSKYRPRHSVLCEH